MQSHRFPNPRYFLANFDKWVKIVDEDLHTMDPNIRSHLEHLGVHFPLLIYQTIHWNY